MASNTIVGKCKDSEEQKTQRSFIGARGWAIVNDIDGFWFLELFGKSIFTGGE
jgi:hypothetical protein